MSTLIFDPTRSAQSTAVSTFPFSANAWPLERVKYVVKRIVQLTAISLVLASIPDDSGPVRPHAVTTSHSQVILRVLKNADR